MKRPTQIMTHLLTGASVLAVAALAESALPPTGAAFAQMSKEPFRFRVRGNPTRANLAVIMRQVENGGLNGNSGGGVVSSGSGSSTPLGAITTYNSTTVGNMNEITTILEDGAQGYVNLDTSQDGSDSSQSASNEGTQISGGNTAIGSGDATAQSTTTNNNAPSDEGEEQAQDNAQ